MVVDVFEFSRVHCLVGIIIFT